eukprot:jgi/Mesvir1/28686/Mv11178-RA.1
MRRHFAVVQVRRCLLQYAAASFDGSNRRAAGGLGEVTRGSYASFSCLTHKEDGNSVGDRPYRRLSPWFGTRLYSKSLPVVTLAHYRPQSTVAKSNHDFYAEESVRFASLGIARELEGALERAGLARPTQIQAAGIPAILRQETTIIAAETGSGKTLTYLIPIYDMLLASRREQPVPEGQLAPDFALVLCPNATLCDQVVRVANSIAGAAGGAPRLTAMVLSGKVTPPRHPPDIAVATPAGLLTCLMESPHGARARKEFIQNVRIVVVDEADMLLTGGFEVATLKVLDTLRRFQRQVYKDYEEARRAKLEEEGGEGRREEEGGGQRDEPGGGVLPAPRAGAGMRGTRWRTPGRESRDVGRGAPRLRVVATSGHGDEEEEDVEEGVGDDHVSGADDDVEMVSAGDTEALVDFLRRQGMGGVPFKQYVYVAATLPESGKKSVGQWLKKRHPEATWVAGSLLHRRSPNLSMAWAQVTPQERRRVLLDAVLAQWSDSAVDGVNRTMVFANSTEAAQYIANDMVEDLQGGAATSTSRMPAGAAPSTPVAWQGPSADSVLQFHSGVPARVREEALRCFQQQGGIFVCTDSAARGLDVRGIGHVIQARLPLGHVLAGVEEQR